MCDKVMYVMPAEWEVHERTWLQWPFNETNKGDGYREKLDDIWVAMTKELHTGERVGIIVCNEKEKEHVIGKLENAEVDLKNIDILVQETDDVWVRDDGPIFVKDSDGQNVITDWRFNGWGGRYPFENDAKISAAVSESLSVKRLEMKVCLEGGAIEVNGKGSFIASKSSIINENRNPNLTQSEIEAELTKYLGITNFIWIDGLRGQENHDEVTDFHIDGAARFADSSTILYEYEIYEEGQEKEVAYMEKHLSQMRLLKDEAGSEFTFVPVPVTRELVKGTDSKGSYLNYYIGNEVVLVPIYGDPHDILGLKIIEGFFPTRRVVGIHVCDLYAHGGMIHCVTQQQPK